MIVKYGDRILRESASPVDAVTEDVVALADKLVETMYAMGGVGLAAPQIGDLRRVIVWDAKWMVDKFGEKDARVMINPEITWESDDDIQLFEGCLSLPEVFGKTFRPKSVKVRYITRGGIIMEETLTGLAARAAQHEIDHLNGVLFIDKMSPQDRGTIAGLLAKIRKGGAEDAGEQSQ